MTELSSKAASLVRAGRGAMRPTAGDRERISAALRARLGDAALPAEAGAAGSILSRALMAKISIITAAIGLAGAAAYFGLRDSSAPAAPAAAVAVEAFSANALPPALVAPEPSRAVTAVTNTPAAEAAPPATRRDRLAQEVAILSRATSELHAGRAASALRALDEHQRKFPNGLLSEERRAARAQALCASGRRAEAQADLARLSKTAPQSPNTLRAKQVCGVNSSTR